MDIVSWEIFGGKCEYEHVSNILFENGCDRSNRTDTAVLSTLHTEEQEAWIIVSMNSVMPNI
jgi:hypothetical protein